MAQENFKPEENSDLDKAITKSLAKGANDNGRQEQLLKQAGLENEDANDGISLLDPGTRVDISKILEHINPEDVIADMQFEALKRSVEPDNKPYMEGLEYL